MKGIRFGGASRDRTDDLIVANDALSQLSYSPTGRLDPGWLILSAFSSPHQEGRPIGAKLLDEKRGAASK